MEYSIGIDIGGTKIASAIIDQTGRIIHKLIVSTPSSGGVSILKTIQELVTRLVDSVEAGVKSDIRGIGIGTAGQIDFHKGRVLSGTTNIRDWNDIDVRQYLASFTDLPIWVDNDVNVMTLTEAYLGAAIGHLNVVCLALGTGVGGGVLTGGELLHGTWGGASELGHVSVDMNGPACNCGLRGCLETYASGTGIANRMRDQLSRVDKPGVTDACRTDRVDLDPAAVTSREVFQWAREGDRLALKVVDQMFTALAVAIVNFIHTFNPTMIVLGGGLMEDGAWILDGVVERVSNLGIRSMVDPVDIRIASFGPDTSVIGAAYQCFVYGDSIAEGNESGVSRRVPQ